MPRKQLNSRFFITLLVGGFVVLVALLMFSGGKVTLSGSAVNDIPRPTATPTEVPTELPNIPIMICHKTDTGVYVTMQIGFTDLAAHQAHGDIYPVPANGCPVPPVPTTPANLSTVITIKATCANNANPKGPQFVMFTIKNEGGDMTTPGSYTVTRNGNTIYTNTFTFVAGQKGNSKFTGGGQYVMTITGVPNEPITFTQNC